MKNALFFQYDVNTIAKVFLHNKKPSSYKTLVKGKVYPATKLVTQVMSS